MDENTPVTPSENTANNQPNQTPETPQIKTSDFTKKSRSWKNPYALVFAVVFAGLGTYAIINGFAATAALTKVWQTSADWGTGTLANTTIVNNAVTLTPVVAGSTASSPAASGSATTSQSLATAAAAAATTPTVTADTNLALKKPVVASSTNDDNQPTPKDLPASYAVDGSLSTRWGSQYSDPQWIYVDLGAKYDIKRVQLDWNTAYGKSYKIQVSNDAKTWTTAYSTRRGTGKVNNLTGLTASGRFVRVYGTVRGTVWGYSLHEMSVYGASTSTTTPTPTPATPTYAVTASKPTANSTISGNATFSGTQSGFKNIEVWYNGVNVGTAAISGNTWTANVDTTKQTNGAQKYTVYVWDVTAGQQAQNSLTQDVNVTVNNTAPAPSATTYNKSGTITLGYDAKSSVTWTSLKPQATTPTGTSITYQARTSADNTNWSAWNSDFTSLASSRYIQVRATLSTTNTAATPTLTSLTLGYNATVASPTVTLTATPSTISAGQNATLTWSSTNATTCTATGGWSGAKTISGSAASAILTANTTFNLACSGDGGTANASANVTVTPVSTGGGGTSTSGGCTYAGALAPCIGSATTGANPWGGSAAPTLAFADEFNGSSLDTSKWVSSWGNGGWVMNNVSTSPSNVSVSGGNLILKLSSSSTGALVSTRKDWNPAGGGFEFGTGYYVEGRILFQGQNPSNASGTTNIYNWPAFWTSGVNWPNEGEIDIAEAFENPFSSPYHYPGCGEQCADNGPGIPGMWANAYHTYAVDRENGHNYVYWDGKLVRSYSTYDNGGPESIHINVGYRGDPVGTVVTTDYVRVWKK